MVTVLAVSDTVIVQVGTVLCALIAGIFAFAGVVINAKSQQKPKVVALTTEQAVAAALAAKDVADEIADLTGRLREMEGERNMWRRLAVSANPALAVILENAKDGGTSTD